MVNDVQRLRETTGAGIMECKRALVDAGGDFEKAKAILKEKGLKRASSKAERATGAGWLESYIHNGRVGVLLEIRAETDFVLKSEPFRNLAKEIVMQITAMAPESVEALLAQPYVKDDKLTIGDLVQDTIAKIGENIQVTRFSRYEV
ncbi:MAG: translation elongation factor Ts [Patescibacteria group bacterium]